MVCSESEGIPARRAHCAGGITISVGVAQAGSDSGLFDMPSLIEQADKCLYQAKRDGRNCTRYTTV